MPKQPLLTPNLKYRVIIKDSEVVVAQHLSALFPSSLFFFHHVAQTLRHLEETPELGWVAKPKLHPRCDKYLLSSVYVRVHAEKEDKPHKPRQNQSLQVQEQR